MVATVLAITRLNAVHALLYLIVSLLAIAVIFYTMGAPLVAALELIIYAGAIMVLFVFVVMMLNLGKRAAMTEGQWLQGNIWVGPVLLSAVLIAEVVYLILRARLTESTAAVWIRNRSRIALFGPYVIGVELSSMLLLGGLVGAYHLGRPALENSEDDMTAIPMEHALILAGILFTMGLTGLLTRRNLVFTLMCIEIMLNASGTSFCRRRVALGPARRTDDVSLHSGDGGGGSFRWAGAGASVHHAPYARHRRRQRDERLTCSASCG